MIMVMILSIFSCMEDSGTYHIAYFFFACHWEIFRLFQIPKKLHQENRPNHQNSQPSFLGVINPVLQALKPAFFHGFWGPKEPQSFAEIESDG